MSNETRISSLERRITELSDELDAIKSQLGRMPSRTGGKVVGQLHIDGWTQFEEQESVSTPSAGMVRLVALSSGGAVALQAAFPDGHFIIIAQ